MASQLNCLLVFNAKKQVILTPFPLTGNCKELNFLSQIRVLLGTIIDTLIFLTLVRRNRGINKLLPNALLMTVKNPPFGQTGHMLV